MKTSEENIKRLLEMLDNPSAYSEQEISDIINRDDETREAYRLMVAAKQSYRKEHTAEEADAQAAWQRFEQRHSMQTRPMHRWTRIAAIFIAAAFITGLSFGAYHAIAPQKDKVAQTDSIFNVVAVNAEYPGGFEKCFDFASKNMKYPRPCKFFGIKGRLIVTLVVEKDGSLSNIRKLRGPGIKLTQKQVDDYNAAFPGNSDNLQVGQDLGELLFVESERILSVMPRWTPGKDAEGRIVRSRFILPFIFRLE